MRQYLARPNLEHDEVPFVSEQEVKDGFRTRSQIIDDKDITLSSGVRPTELVIRKLFDSIEQVSNKNISPKNVDITVTDFGHPVTAHARRKEIENAQGKGSIAAWYYDKDSVLAINNILENTIINKPDELLNSSFVKVPLKETIQFNDSEFVSTRVLKKDVLTAIWNEMEQKAEAAYKEKFGTTAARRYDDISEFGKKPKDWPASDTVVVGVDGHNLSMTFAKASGETGKAEWNVNKSSLGELANIYLGRLPKQRLLGVTMAAARLGINRFSDDSVEQSNYSALSDLFERMNKQAEKTSTDGLTATIEIEDRKFKLEKPEGRKTWLLHSDSLPEVSAALGLPPKINHGSLDKVTGIEGSTGYEATRITNKEKNGRNRGE